MDAMTLINDMVGFKGWENHADGWWMDASGLDMVETAHRLAAAGARLMTMTGAARADGETTVIYHYALGGQVYHFITATREQKLPSITPETKAANWIEREIQDLFAVTFESHPQGARLIRPPQLEPGFFRRPGGADSRPQES